MTKLYRLANMITFASLPFPLTPVKNQWSSGYGTELPVQESALPHLVAQRSTWSFFLPSSIKWVLWTSKDFATSSLRLLRISSALRQVNSTHKRGHTAFKLFFYRSETLKITFPCSPNNSNSLTYLRIRATKHLILWIFLLVKKAQFLLRKLNMILL